jgi:hypothetical protein
MLEAYEMPDQQKTPGETMTNRTAQTTAYRYPYRYWLAETLQDALMVSSFGLWAALLGFAPVVAFFMLRGG